MNLFGKIIIIILSIVVGAAAILTPIYFTVPTFKEKVDNIFADSEQPDNPDEPDTPEPEVPEPQYETNSLLNLTPTTLQLQNTESENSYTNPYLIHNADDLRTLAYYVNTKFEERDVNNLALQQQYTRGHFVLKNHIDISKWTQWEPIGTEENPFVGTFSGNGYSIYGLTIIDTVENAATSDYAGLFGVISYVAVDDVIYKPVIERLGLKDTVIKTNRDYAGAIVGAAYGNEELITPTYQTKQEEENIGGDETANRTYSDAQAAVVIQDCYNTGYVEGGNYVGGLAGAVYYGAVIYNSYNAPSTTNAYNTEFDVYSSNENASGVGGIVGYVDMAVNAAAINNTISTVKVGKTNVSNDSTNMGYIIGSKTAIQSYLSRYGRNIFMTRDLSFSNDAGTGYAINLLTSSSLVYDTLNGFSITQYTTDQWASNTNTVWVMQLNANNGLPVLYNVPQLVQISVNATDGQGNAISKEKVSAYIDTEHCTPALTTFTGNKYFKHGQFAYITAEVKDANLLNDYKFVQWNYTLLGDSIVAEKLNEKISLNSIFNKLTNKDCVFTIVFALNNTCGIEVTESCARLGFDTTLNVSKADTATSWNFQETATVDASSNNAGYVIVEIKVADAYKDAVTIEDNTIIIDFAKLYEQFNVKEIIVPIEIIYDYVVPALPNWTGNSGDWVGGGGTI